MTFGEKIQYLRKEKGLTQAEIAEVFHVSRGTISSWEVGRTYPDLTTIVSMSDFFDVSLDNLLREDEIMVVNITKEMKVNRWWRKVGIAIIATLVLLVSYGWWYTNTDHLTQIEAVDKSELIYGKITGIDDAMEEPTIRDGKQASKSVKVSVKLTHKAGWKPHLIGTWGEGDTIYIPTYREKSWIGRSTQTIELDSYYTDFEADKEKEIWKANRIILVFFDEEEENYHRKISEYPEQQIKVLWKR